VIIVSNSSPLIGLDDVGRLDLLHTLYGSLIIPRAVSAEFTAGRTPRLLPEWIEVREIANRPLAAVLRTEVHAGEAEAIALAVDLEADLVLLDDRHGRRVAAEIGLRHIGALGVLIEAKRRGFLEAIGPLIDELVAKKSFWVSEDLRRRVLQAAGEL
jgi:uncharacterized protein